jgi:hypothetical protein
LGTLDGFEMLGDGFCVDLVEMPFGRDCLGVDGVLCCLTGGFGACLTGTKADSGRGANALNGRCECAVFEGSFGLGLACFNDPGFADEGALTSTGLTDGEDVGFVGVPFVPDRFGVTVLFADTIPYALAGIIVVVVVAFVVVVDDFDLGACFLKSSSLFRLSW